MSCCGKALYAVFYRRVFFKTSRAELFDCGVANVMSKVTQMLVCLFFLLVWFALVHLKNSYCLASPNLRSGVPLFSRREGTPDTIT